MDALKCEKVNEEVSHCNDIVQRKRKICGIWRRQIFNIKKNLLNQGRKLIYLGGFERRSLSRKILNFFRRPSPQLTTFDMTLAELKQLKEFPVMSKNTLCKWSRKIRFCISDAIKKCKGIKKLLLMLCTGVSLWILRLLSVWNFVNNGNLAKVFSCEFWEFFQLAASLKTRLCHSCFLVKCEKFFIVEIL